MNSADATMPAITLLHRARDATGNGMTTDLAERLAARGFYAATCMRELVVLPGTPALYDLPRDHHTSVLRDAEAFAFVLQTTTGLNSSVPGETNVQGQLRKGWSAWRSTADARLVLTLSPIIHRLFNDAGEIRRRYLEGIGGNSYGSLARKLLQPAADARVLFVGAGDLAASMLPFFSSAATGIWNRHTPDADFAPGTRRFHDRQDAVNWATHVVMTTPPDTNHDSAWASLCVNTRVPVVHLGRRRAAPGNWTSLEEFYSLDDLFDLRRSQSSLRSLQTVLARAACEQFACTYYTAASGDVLAPLSAASA